MDLNDFDLCRDADDGFEMIVKNPRTGKPTDIKISVIGSDSKTYRAAKSKIFRKAASSDVDTDDLSAEVYAACVTGWSGVNRGGKDIDFSYEAALSLFTDLPWLMDQVGVAVETRANFTKEPAKS